MAAAVPLAEVKRNSVHLLGNRITVELDDRTTLVGKLLSISSTGNLILSDVVRERRVKRSRNATSNLHRTVRECYATVLFVRGGSVVSVRFTQNLVTDKSIVDEIGTKQSTQSRVVQVANMSPSIPLG